MYLSDDEEPTIANRDRSGDGRFRTKRTLLQEKKSEVIPQINKAILIRRGAENMLNAAYNKSVRAKVEEEADGQTSTLRLLKDKMDTYNSSFSTYQALESRLPSIPIGLKETSPIDFEKHLSTFISEHYHCDPKEFSDALQQMTNSREKVQTPIRSKEGARAFRNYYVLLNTVEHRFFDENIKHSFRFSWTDAFTGEEHSQRSPAFEKGALTFNFAALCSQIAVNYNSDSLQSLDKQIEMFLQAKSNLQILQESFAHAPSKDMGPEVLNFLVQIMTVQAQECVFMKKMLDSAPDSGFLQLAKYIGGASMLSEQFGKLSSPSGPLSTPEDWKIIVSVVPISWFSLLDIKSKFFQAQAYYQLASVVINLAVNGSTEVTLNDNPQLGQPIFTDTDTDLLDNQIIGDLDRLFFTLKPYLKLNKKMKSTSKAKFKGLRRHKSFSNNTEKEPRSHSRLRRPISSLSWSSWGRSKSHPNGLNDTSGRMSSISVKSTFSKGSAVSIQSLGLTEDESEQEAAPPSSRRDAYLLGQVCLIEALTWMQQALLIFHAAGDLRKEEDLKLYLSNLVNTWTQQLDLVKRAMKSPTQNGHTSGPTPKPRRQWLLPKSKSQNKGSSPTASSIPPVSINSQSLLVQSIKESTQNPWNAPTFLSDELELPKDMNKPLKVGFLKESQDPFRLLGPQNYFNAKKWWSEPFKARLVRDELVGYGFSIQGDGPVEILGVDPDTPASDNFILSSDLVVGINGLDARFMVHGEAVQAIRFGTLSEQGDDESLPSGEVDIVELTLVRPILPPVVVQRKPSTSIISASNTVGTIIQPKQKIRKHNSVCSNPTDARRKSSVSSFAFKPDDGFFSKLRKHSSSMSTQKDLFLNNLRSSPYN